MFISLKKFCVAESPKKQNYNCADSIRKTLRSNEKECGQRDPRGMEEANPQYLKNAYLLLKGSPSL